MTMSSLANKGFMSTEHYSQGRDGQSICKFTPHYMAGDLSCEGCVSCWVNRDASANYGIDSDGNIACFVDEDNRAWTSSSASNDSQAITVEVANLDNNTGEISDAAWQSLVRLATDVCHRYNFRLNYTGDPSGSLTMHKMFSATSCPGPWIESHMEELASTVNNNLDTGNFSYSGTSGTSSSKSGKLVVSDPASAYAAGIAGKILFSQEEIYPYIITIDSRSPELDLDKLKTMDVVGVCIDMGSYYTESHTINSNFRSPALDSQFEMVKAANLSVGLMTDIRARTVEEVKEELYQIRLAVLRYVPDMGIWLRPHFVSDKPEVNDKLIDEYYKKLYKLGFYDQVGLYCKKEELEKISWVDKYCEDWYWWMDRHLTNVDKIHSLPVPRFFFYDNPKDEDGLINPK